MHVARGNFLLAWIGVLLSQILYLIANKGPVFLGLMIMSLVLLGWTVICQRSE